MTQDEIIEMARQADVWVEEGFLFEDVLNAKTLVFAKLVEEKKQAEMQGQIETLYRMYEQACQQRDALMDQQRAQIAAMRGRMQ